MTPPAGRYGQLPRVPSAFVPTPAAQQAVRRLPPLVVMRAARGFGKTSTAAYWLRRGELGELDAAWLPITQPIGADRLWVVVLDGLAGLGLFADDDKEGLAAVRSALGRLRRRLVLVIDNLHLVGAGDQLATATMDDELVALVQQFELLHLMVLSRDERPIESLALANVDSIILRREDLVLDSPGVQALALRLGIELSRDQASTLSHELLGWPALLRASLLALDPLSSDDVIAGVTQSATDYAKVLFTAPDMAELLPLIGVLALAESLTQSQLEALPSSRGYSRVLPQLYATGFIGPHDDGHYYFPRTVREAVTAMLQDEEPELYRRLHGDLAQLRRDEDAPADALHHAVQAGHWSLATAIAEASWSGLRADRPGVLREALGLLPEEYVARRPVFIVTRDVILHHQTRERAQLFVASGALEPRAQVTTGPVTLTQRLAGMFGVPSTMPAAMAERWDELPEEVQQAVPAVLLQWGLSRLYENDAVGAAYALALAGERADQVDDLAVRRKAAALSALALGLLGHLRSSESWLTDLTSLPGEPSELEHVAQLVARRHTSWLALADGAATVDPPLQDSSRSAHPLLELARLIDAHRSLVERRSAGPDGYYYRTHATTTLVRTAAEVLMVDVHLATGKPDGAGSNLAGSANPALTRSRARHAFYIGAHEEVVRLTTLLGREAARQPWLAIDLTLLHACAALRLDQHDRAVDQLSTALVISEDTGILMPFLLVPRGDLLAIAEGDHYAEQFLARPELARRRCPFPEPLRSADLSAAELRVLVRMAHDLTVPQIGRALFIAESTVKTHVSRIYRKLGVTNRAAALERARNLALIR